MNYKYTTNKVSFTDVMKTYCQDHFASLEKFLSDNEPIKITLSKESDDSFVIKSQVVSKMNRRLRAEVTGRNLKEEFYAALIEVRDSLEKQLKKKKEKNYWKERITRPEISSEALDVVSVFVRNKVFVLDSITPEQAVDELENSGYTWYAFRDLNNKDAISVVYKRFDGETFGLVELK